MVKVIIFGNEGGIFKKVNTYILLKLLFWFLANAFIEAFAPFTKLLKHINQVKEKYIINQIRILFSLCSVNPMRLNAFLQNHYNIEFVVSSKNKL